MFAKAIPKRAFEDVAQQIRDAIVKGELKPGDRLPSQRELQDMFQVSRATIMAALRVLEKADLITVRAGASGGSFVSHATSETVAESLRLLLTLEGVSLRELAEFRERIEGGTAFWTAQRADASALATLEASLIKLRELAEAGASWGDFLAEDIRFHWAVAEASGNRPSSVTMKAITRVMCEAHSYITPGLHARVLSDVGGIIEAIRKRQPQLAERRMQEHVAFFCDDMIGNWNRHIQQLEHLEVGLQAARTSAVLTYSLFGPPRCTSNIGE